MRRAGDISFIIFLKSFASQCNIQLARARQMSVVRICKYVKRWRKRKVFVGSSETNFDQTFQLSVEDLKLAQDFTTYLPNTHVRTYVGMLDANQTQVSVGPIL